MRPAPTGTRSAVPLGSRFGSIHGCGSEPFSVTPSPRSISTSRTPTTASAAYQIAGYGSFTDVNWFADTLLAYGRQDFSLDALTGSAGLQVRVPVLLSTGLYSPFLNVTAEHDVLGSGRTLTTTQVTAPLLPVLTPVPEDDRTYGKVAVGVAAVRTGNVSATAATGNSHVSGPVTRDGTAPPCSPVPGSDRTVPRPRARIPQCWPSTAGPPVDTRHKYRQYAHPGVHRPWR